MCNIVIRIERTTTTTHFGEVDVFKSNGSLLCVHKMCFKSDTNIIIIISVQRIKSYCPNKKKGNFFFD